MARGPIYDRSRGSTRAYRFADGQKLAIGAASVQSAAVDAIEVMLRASVRCFVKVGANPTAADAAGAIPLEAGESFHLQMTDDDGVPAPAMKVAVIQASGAGSLYILPVT